jgi:hypothetical protein
MPSEGPHTGAVRDRSHALINLSGKSRPPDAGFPIVNPAMDGISSQAAILLHKKDPQSPPGRRQSGANSGASSSDHAEVTFDSRHSV